MCIGAFEHKIKLNFKKKKKRHLKFCAIWSNQGPRFLEMIIGKWMYVCVCVFPEPWGCQSQSGCLVGGVYDGTQPWFSNGQSKGTLYVKQYHLQEPNV